MSAGAESKPGAPGASGNRRPERATPKVNRAQLRAMEVRAAETVRPAVPVADVAGPVVAAEPATSARPSAISRRRPVIAKPIVLTKEEEYRYIRADMRRLGITAGGLFVLMIALLFVLE